MAARGEFKSEIGDIHILFLYTKIIFPVVFKIIKL